MKINHRVRHWQQTISACWNGDYFLSRTSETQSSESAIGDFNHILSCCFSQNYEQGENFSWRY